MAYKRPEVRRFVSFKSLGPERRGARISALPQHYTNTVLQAGTIFDAAEQLLLTTPANEHLVFPGFGMRPLFEAVRGLNEVTGNRPRRRIRFVITPWSGRITPAKIPTHIKLIRERIGRIPNVSQFAVVDYACRGYTYRAIRAAIRDVNPVARVRHLRQDSGPLQGIDDSEHFFRPAKKTEDGYLVLPGEEADRAAYLLYQKLLQEWLDRKRAEHALTK